MHLRKQLERSTDDDSHSNALEASLAWSEVRSTRGGVQESTWMTWLQCFDWQPILIYNSSGSELGAEQHLKLMNRTRPFFDVTHPSLSWRNRLWRIIRLRARWAWTQDFIQEKKILPNGKTLIRGKCLFLTMNSPKTIGFGAYPK